MIRKKENWVQMFLEVYAEHEFAEFKFGYHDCCATVVDMLSRMTGIDVMECLGRRYRSERGAKIKLKRHGGVLGLGEFVATHFEVPETTIRRAKPGDIICLANQDKEQALGIIDLSGRECLVVQNNKGWLKYQKDTIIRAWSIE